LDSSLGGLERSLTEALAVSAPARSDPDPHPADAGDRIPDEARILRLLFRCGAQAAIRTEAAAERRDGREPDGKPVTIAGHEAGCRDLSHVERYVEDLCAFGLVSFAHRPLSDAGRYEVLEARPEVAAATRSARTRFELRDSLQLTPFGLRFCTRCSLADLRMRVV
jgi:hypothetical protein